MQALLNFYLGMGVSYPDSTNIDSEVLTIFRDAAEAWGDLSVSDNASLWGIIRNLILEDPTKNMDVYIQDMRDMPIDQIQYTSENVKRQDVRESHDNAARVRCVNFYR